MRVLIVAAVTGVSYLAGLLAHEGTHVIACLLTGSRVEHVRAYPPEVGYVAPTETADALVRSSTVALSIPLLVVAMLWLRRDPWSWRLAVLPAVVSYLPRSTSDWEPIAQLVKSVAV